MSEETMTMGTQGLEEPESMQEAQEQTQVEQSQMEEQAKSEGDEFSELSDIDDENLEVPAIIGDEVFKSIPKFKNDFEEEEAVSRPKKKAASRRKRRTETEPSRGVDRTVDFDKETNEERRRRVLEEKMTSALKSRTTKRRKGDEIDLEQMADETVQALRQLMTEAAVRDAESVREERPAMRKLELLPRVREVLFRANLADSILDNNVLESVRLWLEPLPDGSLPAYEIQKIMFQAIQSYPIKTYHLKESGLGKVVLFYQKSKRVESSLKRIADKLIGDWTRPILEKSDNYRDKQIATAEFDYSKFLSKLPSLTKAEKIASSNKSPYELAAARRNRAAAPSARTTAYTVAPRVNPAMMQGTQAKGLPLGIGSSLNKDDRYKRINQKMHSMGTRKKVGKKSGVSIEGRGLT